MEKNLPGPPNPGRYAPRDSEAWAACPRLDRSHRRPVTGLGVTFRTATRRLPGFFSRSVIGVAKMTGTAMRVPHAHRYRGPDQRTGRTLPRASLAGDTPTSREGAASHEEAASHTEKRFVEKGWTFHIGGRTELQFNVGLEPLEGTDHLRHGVAFSFEPSRDYPWNDLIKVLRPKVERFNEFVRRYPDEFLDLRMWHWRKIRRQEERAPRPNAVAYSAGTRRPQRVRIPRPAASNGGD